MKYRSRAVLGIVAAVVAAALLAVVPRLIGEWLVIADPLEPAGAVVVFGGQVPFRAMEAAAVYNSGMARSVWLTQGVIHEEDLVLIRLGINRPPEHVYSKEVLERLGVPPGDIRILPGRVNNTAEEVQVIAREADGAGVKQVILISSKYHTRRVKILWSRLTGGNIRAIVRYAREDPFDPRHWWRQTGDAMAVSRELAGIANAWAGLPIKSER